MGWSWIEDLFLVALAAVALAAVALVVVAPHVLVDGDNLVVVFYGVGGELSRGKGAYTCTMNRWDGQTWDSFYI